MADQGRLDELKRKFEENPRRYFAPLANEYRKAGEPDMAIELCRTYLPQQPAHMSGYIVYGQSLHDAGRNEEAAAVFQQALALDPENIIALRQLGDISRAAGDDADAIGWYRKVLDLDPRNDEIASFITALEHHGEAPARDWSAPERPIPPAIHPEPEHAADTLALEDLVRQPESHRVTPTEAFRAHENAPPDPAPHETAAEPEPLAPFEAFQWREATPDEQRAADEHIPLDEDVHEPPASTVEHAEPNAPDELPATAGHDEVSRVDEFQYDEWSFDNASGTLASLESEPEPTPSGALPFLGGAEDTFSATPFGSHDDVSDAEPPLAEEVAEAHAEDVHEPEHAAVREESHDDGAADELLKFAEVDSSAHDAASPARTATSSAASPFVTETMAELYMQQGLDGEALAIYRQLATRRDDPTIRARIAELEKKTGATPDHAELAIAAMPAAVLPPTGESVRAFFTRIGARRPAEHAHIAAESESGLASLFGGARADDRDIAAAQSLAGAFAGQRAPARRD